MLGQLFILLQSHIKYSFPLENHYYQTPNIEVFLLLHMSLIRRVQ